MSLIDNLPDRATIRRVIRRKDALGSARILYETEQTNVVCWDQPSKSSETREFERRGFTSAHKIYFQTDPGVTERHEILITSRSGVAIANPIPLTVKAQPLPDVTSGLGYLFMIMADDESSSD